MAKMPTPPGSYFFFIVCAACERDIKLDPAPSPESKPRLNYADGTVPCPHCGAINDYRADAVRRGRVIGDS